MKKFLIITFLSIILNPICYAGETNSFFNLSVFNKDVRNIKSLLRSQVKYANKTDFERFIATYDDSYVNSDGFNLEIYSQLVKDIWSTYNKIEYGIKIKNINVTDDKAKVELEEMSYADIPLSKNMSGKLQSNANSVYYLQKEDGAWKVVSDEVVDETTTMLYGNAMDLDIRLTAPHRIPANTEYCASLEFTPPAGTLAIASIAMDKVEYPQNQTKEVFRKLPEDNVLERLFVSNSDNLNEYIVASIGLTKTDVSEENVKLSLTGFGYKIVRVNVTPNAKEQDVEDK